MQPRRKVGFFIAPFIALLTFGLQKPSADETCTSPNSEPHNNNRLAGCDLLGIPPQRDAHADSEIEIAENRPAIEQQFPGISLSANEFMLSARLASTASLNKPKTPSTKIKKTGLTNSVLPHTLRSIKSNAKIDAKKSNTATVLIFPGSQKRSIARRLARAA